MAENYLDKVLLVTEFLFASFFKSFGPASAYPALKFA